MDEMTWNFACRVVLWGTFEFWPSWGHTASMEAKPIFLISGAFWVSNMHTQHPGKIIIKIWPHINHTYWIRGQSIFEILKLNRKQKLFRTPGFFLDFFPQLISTTGSWDMPPTYHVTLWPGPKPNLRFQNSIVVLNHKFFLRFFFPAHIDHWKLR